MVDLFISSSIFIATAFIGVHGNPILTGCVVQSSLDLANCERDARNVFGNNNDTATDCCFHMAVYDCYELHLSKRCPKDKFEILQSFMNADATAKVYHDCLNVSKRLCTDILNQKNSLSIKTI